MPEKAPPTREQIEERCREIQATWTPDEEMRRRVRKEHEHDYSKAVRVGE